MKQLFLLSLICILFSEIVKCQNIDDQVISFKKITLLKNNTFEIKEFTNDSLLIYKGILSSRDPDVRHGKFYFFNNQGKVIVTGLYNQDIPYGIWVYYNESSDTIKAVNYTAVWKYLENDALDYTIDSTILKSLKEKDKMTMNDDGTFFSVSQMPKFNNKDALMEFNNFINESLVFPIYAARKGITGEINVQFVVDSHGKIRNPVITNPIISDLNIEAIRVLTESPIWEPGYQRNFPINVKYNWKIYFQPWSKFSIITSLLENERFAIIDNEKAYYQVEEMPSFKAGNYGGEFMKFIFKNLRYPENAQKREIGGTVVVQFVINSKGLIVNPVVTVSVDPDLDKEALRVISASPPWNPGKQNGIPVNVIYTLPLKFVTK
jgi:TonB family protein